MSDSKEMLEATVKGLQEKVDGLTKDLATKKDQLADINKPKISQSVYEMVEDCIFSNMANALDGLSENDYDVELELSGNEICVYNLSYHYTNNISEYIMEQVNEKFNVVEDEEEETTTTDNS